MIEAVLFCEFDIIVGPKITFQDPEKLILSLHEI